MNPSRLTCVAGILLLSGSVVTASSAGAQTIPSPYRFVETSQEGGAFIGFVDADGGRFDFGPDPGPMLGLRYAVELGGPFSLDGVLRGIPTTRDVINPRQVEGNRKVGEADVLLASLDARLKFSLTGRRTWHGLTPYLLLGGGGVTDLEGKQEIDRTLEVQDRFDFGTALLGLIGAGARWHPSERFEVRADVVLNLWQLDTPLGFEDPTLEFEGVSESVWTSNPSVGVGIAYRW